MDPLRGPPVFETGAINRTLPTLKKKSALVCFYAKFSTRMIDLGTKLGDKPFTNQILFRLRCAQFAYMVTALTTLSRLGLSVLTHQRRDSLAT